MFVLGINECSGIILDLYSIVTVHREVDAQIFEEPFHFHRLEIKISRFAECLRSFLLALKTHCYK